MRRSGNPPALRWTLERLDTDLAQVARGGDPTYPCAAVKQALVELADNHNPAAVAAVKPARAACQAALVAFGTERASAVSRARAGSGKECVDLDRAVALIKAFDPEGKDGKDGATLERRHKSLCP